jgi:hypothetical protein
VDGFLCGLKPLKHHTPHDVKKMAFFSHMLREKVYGERLKSWGEEEKQAFSSDSSNSTLSEIDEWIYKHYCTFCLMSQGPDWPKKTLIYLFFFLFFVCFLFLYITRPIWPCLMLQGLDWPKKTLIYLSFFLSLFCLFFVLVDYKTKVA